MKVKTIIIGGGVAGLMCAHELHKRGDGDFMVLTKDIGGRVVMSSDKIVNYGAYFVTKTYEHLAPFLTFTREMKKTDMLFVHAGRSYGMLSLLMLKDIFAYLRLRFMMICFRKRFDIFRKKCLHVSQKNAIKSDPILKELYFTKSSEYFCEKGLHDLVNEYIDEMANAMSFQYPGKSSAFFFLQWASEMLINTLYEYRLNFNKMIHGFKDKIISTEVLTLKKCQGGYIVECSNGNKYESKNVVIATEPWQAKKFYDVEYNSDYVKAYMRHVVGVPLRRYSKKNYVLFSSRADIIAIAKQSDGTYLVYSHEEKLDLSDYFTTFQVLFERWWCPAFLYCRRGLVEADRGDGLYLIGSYNVDGLEDCAITGIWAARQIKK
ncbi:MAG: FAD-binding protein [Candidatus Taylorbacteria bacterium]|nr:FAD-binding protein [Candidatus Taylorbacteria bacterium]